MKLLKFIILPALIFVQGCASLQEVEKPAINHSSSTEDSQLSLAMAKALSLTGLIRPLIEECIINKDFDCYSLSTIPKTLHYDENLSIDWEYGINFKGESVLVGEITEESDYAGKTIIWERSADGLWHCSYVHHEKIKSMVSCEHLDPKKQPEPVYLQIGA